MIKRNTSSGWSDRSVRYNNGSYSSTKAIDYYSTYRSTLHGLGNHKRFSTVSHYAKPIKRRGM